jgi:hypothetical protein
MCERTPPAAPEAPPESQLADLIRRELGIDIDRRALRIFIRAHWDKVAPLAHRIHGAIT